VYARIQVKSKLSPASQFRRQLHGFQATRADTILELGVERGSSEPPAICHLPSARHSSSRQRRYTADCPIEPEKKNKRHMVSNALPPPVQPQHTYRSPSITMQDPYVLNIARTVLHLYRVCGRDISHHSLIHPPPTHTILLLHTGCLWESAEKITREKKESQKKIPDYTCELYPLFQSLPLRPSIFLASSTRNTVLVSSTSTTRSRSPSASV